MLDRMFLAEEQQSLLRLRQELQESPTQSLSSTPPPVPPSLPSTQSITQFTQQSHQTVTQKCGSVVPVATSIAAHHEEEYDEWACIQRELGCLTATAPQQPPPPPLEDNRQPPKRSASSDSRLETLKRFRVEKHNKQKCSVMESAVTSTNIQSCSNSSSSNNSMSVVTTTANTSYDENNSIDEQVQSAIDSILNLQQNTCLDLDDAVSSILS